MQYSKDRKPPYSVTIGSAQINVARRPASRPVEKVDKRPRVAFLQDANSRPKHRVRIAGGDVTSDMMTDMPKDGDFIVRAGKLIPLSSANKEEIQVFLKEHFNEDRETTLPILRLLLQAIVKESNITQDKQLLEDFDTFLSRSHIPAQIGVFRAQLEMVRDNASEEIKSLVEQIKRLL